MSFRNVSIRIKIASAFGLVLIVLAAMGYVAITNLASVNATSVEMHERWMPNNRFADDIRYNMARHRAILSRHVLSTEAEQMTQVESRLTNALSVMGVDRSKFEALPHTQKERDTYAGFSAAFDNYLKVAAETMALSRRNEKDAASKLYMSSVSKVGLEAETTLNQLTDLIREGSDQLRTTGQDLYDRSRIILIGSIALAVLGAGLAGYLLTNAVSRPVLGMTQAMARLAAHDMDVVIPAIGQSDEIGRMADALQVFKDGMIETTRLRSAQAASETLVKARQKETMQTLAAEFEAVIGVVVGTVSSASSELEVAARTLTQTAASTRTQVSGVASSSDEASRNVKAVASATEEMASSVSEIGRQVETSARMANAAVLQAQRTDERICKLTRAADQIGGMVELIRTIAGQTNLLALNATIEAARAGDAGRGFAVVASEVKALATQTALATSDISAQIAEIQEATKESATAIREIGTTIGDISGIASAIAAAVEEQGAATQEISRNVQHAAKGTAQVAGSIAEVNKGAFETGSASAQVLSSAQSLSAESDHLKTEVAKFLTSVRAA